MSAALPETFALHPARAGRAGRLAVMLFMAVSAFAGMGTAAVRADTAVTAKVAAHSVNATGAEAAAPITLGLTYVVPPHLPGAKVRTPEGMAPLLAERLGRELPLRQVQAPGSAVEPDVLLVPADAGGHNTAEEGRVIPTGYRAGIMAIMRTDTDIRRWEDLRGRTVCLAEGGGLRGSMEARYGAIEKIFRAPADALLDLRIGGCDAAVHDSTLLEALLKLPEWQKFSARLPVQDERDLVFIVRKDDAGLVRSLQSRVQEWRDSGLLAKLTRQSAADIAFEVYLDQEVPDCH